MVCIIDAGRKRLDLLWGLYNNWTCGLGTVESQHQTKKIEGFPLLICILLAFQQKF